MQRAVLRLTTTSKGAIFHLDETFDPLRARFSPNPARYSGDEIRSIVAILKFFFFIFGKSFKFLFRLDKREEKSIYDTIEYNSKSIIVKSEMQNYLKKKLKKSESELAKSKGVQTVLRETKALVWPHYNTTTANISPAT